MTLNTFTLNEKVDALDRLIQELRTTLGRDHAVVRMLKAIHTDIAARQHLPRNQVLGELERALLQLQRSKTALGYDEGRMIEVANIIVRRWPTIGQALEQFGEESAE